MSNTAEIVITHFSENGLVEHIEKVSGFTVSTMVLSSEHTQPKNITGLQVDVVVLKNPDPDDIQKLISAFQSFEFDFPETAVMVVDNDNEVNSGIYLPKK